MASIQDIAAWIVESFDSRATLTIEEAIEKVLRDRGAPRFAASIDAAEKATRVSALLRSISPETLPFEFSESHENRLIGKQRTRRGDSPETRAARERFALVPPMQAAVYNCGFEYFEKLCAKLMVLSGAAEALTTGPTDDGGIDIYGRIPLRLRDSNIREGLLYTTFLNQPLLFLAQCKCDIATSSIGRPKIDAFSASVDSCLRKYEGNKHPPLQGVPLPYYRTQETCVRVFFTTADYSDEAQGAAESQDIILVNGRQVADFLVYRGVALTVLDDGSQDVDESLLKTWVDSPHAGSTQLPAS